MYVIFVGEDDFFDVKFLGRWLLGDNDCFGDGLFEIVGFLLLLV